MLQLFSGFKKVWDKDVVLLKCSHGVNSEITCFYREVVSEIEFPDYCRIITTLMDLKWDGIKKL
jgi:hypothetical protein